MPFIVQLLQQGIPMVLQAVKDWQAARTTSALPTTEELTMHLIANADTYLAEGAAWKSTHPGA